MYKLVRKKHKGNFKYLEFKNYYVGYLDCGPVFVSTNKKIKFKTLSSESPEYYAKNKFNRMCEDSSRFNSLNEEIKKEAIRENFRKSLNSYETIEDINNFTHLGDPNHLINGVKEQAEEIQKSKEQTHSKVLTLTRPGIAGKMISDDNNMMPEDNNRVLEYNKYKEKIDYAA